MFIEGTLIEKLRKLEALHAGTQVAGEREAARRAAERIRERLEKLRGAEKEVVLKYRLTDPWTRKLFVALCRRYGLTPYRERGQRYSTVLVRASRTFHDRVLGKRLETGSFQPGRDAQRCGSVAGAGGDRKERPNSGTFARRLLARNLLEGARMSPLGASQTLPPRLFGAIAACALLSSGCADERRAREVLEKEGYSDVVLKRSKEGFDFEAKKGPTSCTGHVSTKSGPFSSSYSHTAFCTGSSTAAPAPPPQSCEEATPGVCFNQGVDAYKAGDFARARSMYEQGCDFGDGTSCTNLGAMSSRGEGAPKDLAAALRLADRACALKSPMGCSNWGLELHAAGKFTEALAAFTRACELRFARGCFEAGNISADPRTGPVDQAKIFSFYKQACDLDHAESCGFMGIRMIRGLGTTKDEARGRALLYAKCHAEEPLLEVCVRLGHATRDDFKKPADAIPFFKRACDGDNGNGCSELGYMTERGAGVSKDLAAAAALYVRACELGSKAGCFNKGYVLERGLGVTKDPDGARVAYEKACALGDEDACKKAR